MKFSRKKNINLRGSGKRKKRSKRGSGKKSKVGFLTRTAMLGAVAGITPSGVSGRSGSNAFSSRTMKSQLGSRGFSVTQRYAPTNLVRYRGPTEVNLPEGANMSNYNQPTGLNIAINNLNNEVNQQPNINNIVRQEIKEYKKDLTKKDRAELAKIIRDGFGIKKMEIKGKKQHINATITYNKGIFTVRKPGNYRNGQWLKIPKNFAISQQDGAFETQLDIGGKTKNFIYVKWI
jgi:hypothetical protein